MVFAVKDRPRSIVDFSIYTEDTRFKMIVTNQMCVWRLSNFLGKKEVFVNFSVKLYIV